MTLVDMAGRWIVLGALISLVVACVPANSLRDTVRLGNGTLGPVPADKAGLIRVSETDAATTVLASERETGWPDPDITWEDGRCVLVAWFEPRPMSRSPDPGPPYPVYLVMLFDPTGANGVSWVMVDARTGELGAAIGGILPGCPGSA